MYAVRVNPQGKKIEDRFGPLAMSLSISGFDSHFQSCIDQRQNLFFQFMSSVTHDKLLNSYNPQNFSLHNGDM